MILTGINLTRRAAVTGAIFLAGALSAAAQSSRIQANVYGGNNDNGKCTIEVEVDGAAEVRIIGNQADIRTLSGSPAFFRRMECNGIMPSNPASFRFEGIDGRGRQSLVADPSRTRGQAIVRIDDPDGGREGYTFDVLWSNNNSWNNGGGTWRNDDRDGWNNNGRYNGNGNGRGRNGNNGFGNNSNYGNGNGWSTQNAGRAMRACQDEVASRIRRAGYSDIQFLRAEFDNNGNRADFITGSARALQTFGANRFDFACRADLATGRLWDVRLDRR